MCGYTTTSRSGSKGNSTSVFIMSALQRHLATKTDGKTFQPKMGLGPGKTSVPVGRKGPEGLLFSCLRRSLGWLFAVLVDHQVATSHR